MWKDILLSYIKRVDNGQTRHFFEIFGIASDDFQIMK